MNNFLTSLSANNPWLWAFFVLGVTAVSAIFLSVLSSLMLKLGSGIAARFGGGKTRAVNDDVVS
ncbi:MAG: hypothetical protein O3A93_10860 [Chloroflexi bacterium]|nr:hypothetical protein [Chloroflexota bacterium]MDA1271741.1 hypothetical protein [Chloroflexota bacterium]